MVFIQKLGYKPRDLLKIQVLSLVENLSLKENPLQDFLSSLNAIISTNESTESITGHVTYNPAYTYKIQLKTTIVILILNSNLVFLYQLLKKRRKKNCEKA